MLLILEVHHNQSHVAETMKYINSLKGFLTDPAVVAHTSKEENLMIVLNAADRLAAQVASSPA